MRKKKGPQYPIWTKPVALGVIFLLGVLAVSLGSAFWANYHQ